MFSCTTTVPVELFARQKRLYITNEDQTGYAWTVIEAKYYSAFVKLLDYSLIFS
jgi:hypothetical protein